MSNIKSYRDLIVWQKSVALVEKTYRFIKHYPQDEIFGIVSQMRRAAVSIPANIAEGQSRSGQKEFLQFLSISQGSLAELETLVILSRKLDYLKEESFGELLADCDEISRMLSGLRHSLTTRH